MASDDRTGCYARADLQRLTVFIAGKAQLTGGQAGSFATLTVGFALMVSAGGLSWANTGSDYSRYLPAWFLIPYLLVLFFNLLAVNGIDLYSSGLTLQTIGLPVKRWLSRAEQISKKMG